jgi:hypothetical protein
MKRLASNFTVACNYRTISEEMMSFKILGL